MKYIIFSDVHSNLEALEKFLRLVRRFKDCSFLFLGDIVGYGANPNEVIQMVRQLEPLTMVRGNHDKAVVFPEALQMFNPIAARAIEWTRQVLLPSSIKFLEQMPKGPVVVDDITICHGAPFDEDYYIFSPAEAIDALEHCQTRICFFGHTHVPIVYEFKGKQDMAIYYPEGDSVEIKLVPEFRYLINPGSVGQPRDMNPKLSFLVYDAKKDVVKFRRASYDVRRAREKIITSGLPQPLADRLLEGV